MDPNELITVVRFYLRRVRRLRHHRRASLTDAMEAALWEQAELAASRLRRLAELECVPVPIKRRPSQPRRSQ
jgi:hypothetical protein